MKNPNSKIFSVKNRKGIQQQLKAFEKIVFTNGCFDVFHLGHAEYLYKARQLGDVLVVGLNSDKSIKSLKGENRPINNEFARAYVLASLYYVDYIAIFEEETPAKLITEIMPAVLVKGGDYQLNQIVGADIVKTNGGKVCTIPLTEGYSSTAIINTLCLDGEE